MIIQNYRALAQSRSKKNALRILDAGLRAAMPDRGLARCVRSDRILVGGETVGRSDYSDLHIVAFGKSADRMAAAADRILRVRSGIIVMPRGARSAVRSRRFRVFGSSHPVPDQSSVTAARAVVKFLKRRKRSDFVLFLVSGGGSSLLCLPDGIELSDKTYATDLLLRSGAAIREINCVRKHLSQIKGGRLAENLPCGAAALVMSDVVGDDLSAIASGTTYCDSTTFGDALSAVRRHKLEGRMPAAVLDRLARGAGGEIPETPKSPAIPNAVIARNRDCTDAMTTRAEQLGYSAGTITIQGDVRDAASEIIDSMPRAEKSCLIFGGETTVRVRGGGLGGRNQELVLRLLKELQGEESTVIASVGTDGIDGNTEYAGALVDNFGVDTSVIDSHLRSSNSGAFFAKYGGLVRTGHTHTNLTDIGIVLR